MKEEKFWSKTCPEPNTGCLLWTGFCDEFGRGWVTRGSQIEGAPRAAFRFSRGSLEEGLCVLHKCDTPNCVNPDHLFLGTRLDNNRDRSKKGRTARMRGQLSANHKLSKSDVDLIRSTKFSRGTVSKLSRELGVARCTIRNARDGKTYK